jgi:hypothetical protein
MDARNSEPWVSATWRTSVPVSIIASFVVFARLVSAAIFPTAWPRAPWAAFSGTLPPWIVLLRSGSERGGRGLASHGV